MNSIYFSMSTADVSTVITHRINETIDNEFIKRAMFLDIEKAFDKVWKRGFYKNTPVIDFLENYSRHS